jgi:hypothetical protein
MATVHSPLASGEQSSGRFACEQVFDSGPGVVKRSERLSSAGLNH